MAGGGPWWGLHEGALSHKPAALGSLQVPARCQRLVQPGGEGEEERGENEDCIFIIFNVWCVIINYIFI